MNAPPMGNTANPAMNTTVPNATGYGSSGYTGTTGPTIGGHGGHGATMRERAAELQGRGHGGVATTAAATGTTTGAPKAHMGDRMMGELLNHLSSPLNANIYPFSYRQYGGCNWTRD
jgi:hypothetical protein